MKKAVLFNAFAGVCPYFDCEAGVNHGYGCNHKEQEFTECDENGIERGCCMANGCPYGFPATQEDMDEPWCDIDWDGLCSSGEVAELDYLLIETGDDASEEEKEILYSYDRYMHRYDKKWLNEHGIENSLCD